MLVLVDSVATEVRDQVATADTGPRAVDRAETIDRIMHINTSATREFLDGFKDGALTMYLRHLESAQVPRGRRAFWIRPSDMPTVVGYRRRD